MAALLELKQLSKTYTLGATEVAALRAVDLVIERGEFVAIMGPSGSGKSTCMNLLGCLDRPSSGEYFLAGQEVGQLDNDALAKIRNQHIGFVFQQFNLLARTSALDNVALPLLYAGVSPTERLTRARVQLEKVGMGQRLDHHPGQLSGGQQQRVAIARALVNHPELILADEPTGALDSQTSAEVMELVQSLHAQGMTIVLITHEMEIARYTQRIITFRDGQIVSDVQNAEPVQRAALTQISATS